ncbi:MAG: glycosyltransferase family 2 protein [Candidatus Micrarchaeaceae archaeon]|nr:glycosyltransferase family 2 protein [Candidatus Marsarchaeota archaeon]
MKLKSFVSIVIPTLDEEGNLDKLLKTIRYELNDYNYEIIIVDGYSKDKTVKIAKKYKVKILYDNAGKGSALIKGFGNSKGNIIVSMDADLSHRPEELKLLINTIKSGYDICMGSRFLNNGGSEDISMIRRIGNKFFVKLINFIYKSNYTDICYGYRSFSRNALKKLSLNEKGFGIETEISIMAKKNNLKILEIPSFEKKRYNGSGKLRTLQDGYVILKTILKNI